jgi:hypothetical protein
MCKVSVWTIYILDYTKMTKSDKLYSVEICNIHYKICQICSLEYKGFHVKILHVCGIHHSLPLDFCFEMFCRNAFWSPGPYDPVFWANQSRTSWSPPAYIVSYQGCTPEYWWLLLIFLYAILCNCIYDLLLLKVCRWKQSRRGQWRQHRFTRRRCCCSRLVCWCALPAQHWSAFAS